MKCSLHINGFWHHITWGKNGRVGKDQNGHWWFNISNPRDEMGRRPERVDYYNEEARQFLSISKNVLA
jgi:hypothetical protein